MGELTLTVERHESYGHGAAKVEWSDACGELAPLLIGWT